MTLTPIASQATAETAAEIPNRTRSLWVRNSCAVMSPSAAQYIGFRD